MAENYTLISGFFRTSQKLPIPGSDAEAELQRAIDCGDDEDGKKTKFGERTRRAAQAFGDKGAPVVLHLVSIMYKKVPDLVKTTSGEHDAVPGDIVDHLQLLRATMQVHADDGTVAVNQGVALAYPGASGALKSQMMTRFKGEVQKAAAQSLKAFDAHIAPMVELLKRRAFFMPRSGKAAGMADVDQRLLFDKTFLGVEAFGFSADAIAQARAYMQEMRDIAATDPARLKRIDTYRYFAVEKKAVWPELGDIALFWTSIPTSSVSMELAFAMMRKMDAAGRAAMLNATTAREHEDVRGVVRCAVGGAEATCVVVL